MFQEAAKESKAALLSPEDQEDVESPLPSNIVQPVRRRGAISAEPINEEDAATYIKKVGDDTNNEKVAAIYNDFFPVAVSVS